MFDFSSIPEATLAYMSYKGTSRNSHLFKIYTKCTTDETLVYNIGLDTTDCKVEHSRPVAEETKAANGNYRKPFKVNGACKVKFDSSFTVP